MPTLDLLFASPFGALFIFGARIIDVSLDTMRVLFAIRGKRGTAAAFGFFQAMIWILAVGTAIRHLDSVWHILAYAGGYSMGTFVGVTIERAVAYGMAVVRVTSQHGGVEIAEALRERGYGATELSGFGREGKVEIVQSIVHRSDLDDVLGLITTWDAAAVVTVDEPKMVRGGSMPAREWALLATLQRFGRQRA